MGRLSGKYAFITGSGTGIGRAIALKLAREGATLMVTDLDLATAKATLDSLETISKGHQACDADVTSQDSIRRAVELTLKSFARIDILVNNAGVSTMGRFTDLSEEEWDLNMSVNLKGVWRVTKEIVPHMVDAGKGKIVTVASMAAKLGAPLLAHYSGSKFGVLGLMQGIAKEVAENNITVNCVCPGFVHTKMQDREIVWEAELRGIKDPEDVRQEYIDMTPLARLCEPEDVARVALFLASEDSDFMTGQALNVTGGACVH